MPALWRSGCTAINNRFHVPSAICSGAQYAIAAGDPSSKVSQNSFDSASLELTQNMSSNSSDGNKSTASIIAFAADKSLIIEGLINDLFNVFYSKFGQYNADGLNLVFQTQPLLGVFPLGNPSAGGAIPQH